MILQNLDAALVLGLSNTDPNYMTVTADMSSATWNTVASHEILTVTGLIRLKVLVECTATLEDAADGADIQLGVAGATDAIIAVTNAAGKGGNTIEEGELWIDATPADTATPTATAVLDFIVPNGLDVGYEITGAALTAGTLVFHMWPELIGAGASAVIGAGGSL